MMNQTELEGQSEVTILGADVPAGKGMNERSFSNRRHVLSICLIPWHLPEQTDRQMATYIKVPHKLNCFLELPKLSLFSPLLLLSLLLLLLNG